MLTRIEQENISTAVVERLGLRRAREASLYHNPPIENPTGWEGVDQLPTRQDRPSRYRARIRFCDALSGADTRVTLGTKYENAEKAGYAYGVAHIRLYGAVSRYSGAVSTDTLAFLIQGVPYGGTRPS